MTSTLRSWTVTSTTFSSPPPIVNLHFTNGLTQTHGKLENFSLFPKLPIELRLLVYTHAISRRILTVRYNSSTQKFTSPTVLPALLSTCSESRSVAQQHYTLCFGTTTSEPKIYFNPELDTLYLPRCAEMGYDEDFRILRSLNVEAVINDDKETGENRQNTRKISKLDQLRSVAIDHVDPQFKRPWERYNKASFLRGFQLLDEIILVLASCEENHPPAPHPQLETPFLNSQTDNLWRNPRLPPEKIAQIWWSFRQSFGIEEYVLKEVCKELRMDYKGFSLPTVRVKAAIDY